MPLLEIVTSRLCLLPFTQEICQQVLAGEYTALEHAGITPAPGWPDEETLDTLPRILKNLAKVPAPTGFESWMVLKKENMTLIGDAGFKGVPNPSGEVDLGYGIIAAEQQKGYGLEVAQALTNWAVSQPNVQTVTAQCAADNRGSYRILEKLGFERVSQPQGMICWTLSSMTLTCAQQASRFQPVF